jgi:hypothetical protein
VSLRLRQEAQAVLRRGDDRLNRSAFSILNWYQIWYQPCLKLPQSAYSNRPEVAETIDFWLLAFQQ